MPRHLSLFVAVAAPLLMALSCSLPTETIKPTGDLCKALNSNNCSSEVEIYANSAKDGKWYACPNQLFLAACLTNPNYLVSDQQAALLDAWAAGNPSGSSTPPVTDPVFTDTPTTPPPPPTVIDD